MIDAGRGTLPSLAAAGKFDALARGLAAYPVFSVLMTADRAAISDLMISEASTGPGASGTAFDEGRGLLAPYSALAVALGYDDAGLFTLVLLLHEDSTTAGTNAERLEAWLKGSLDRGTIGILDSKIVGASVTHQWILTAAKLRVEDDLDVTLSLWNLYPLLLKTE
jgi:hypothetical protein